MKNLKDIDQLKEKLMKLTHTGILAQITTLNSKGDKEYHNGLIFYQPNVDEKLQIFDPEKPDIKFKPEAVVMLKAMGEVWHTPNPSNVINYDKDNWG